MSAATQAAPALAPGRRRSKRIVLTRRETWSRRLPLLPALLLVIALTQVPFAMTLYYSTLSWNLVGAGEARFIGARNFTRALNDGYFWQALGNTGVMVGATVILSLLLGTLMALALDREVPGRGLLRTLAITPFFLMPVAAALFWKTAFFDPTFGVLGWMTQGLGIGRLDWLSQYPRLAIILLSAWQWTAFVLMIVLAGLQSFPHEVREAAALDGAGPLQVLTRLVLPHLRPFLELAGLLVAMYVLENVALIAILTGGGPAYATTNLSYYVYLQAFSAFSIGKASAYGIVSLVIAIALVLPLLKLVSSILSLRED